ncbi:helix-turn-helix domain-containing protein [Brevundimonas sp. GN22]
MGRPAALSKAQQDEVLKMRSEGASLGAIAKIFGVSRSATQRLERKPSPLLI